MSAKPAKRNNQLATVEENNRKQKAIRLEKQKESPEYELLQNLKKRWEQLRIKHLPKSERRKLVKETWSMVKGHLLDLIYKHDASRIVQSVLKYSETPGDNSDRSQILSELKGHFIQMSQTPYGRFIVIKAIKYSPNAKWRNDIVAEFAFAPGQLQVPNNKLQKLIKHKFAAVVIDTVYCLYANSKERQFMVDAFYGSEYLLTKRSMILMSKEGKIDLEVVFKKFPEKRATILKQFKDTVLGSVGKEGVIGTSELLHRVVFEMLSYMSIEEIQALYQSETSPMHSQFLKDLPSIVHTKHGAQVAITIINSATAKERKAILKSFKTFVAKVAENEYGWMVISCIFQAVDDTVLVKTAIWQELFDGFLVALENKNTKKVMLHLMSGNNTKYFSPAIIALLSTRQEFRQVTSKKDDEIRRQAHLDLVVPQLLALFDASQVENQQYVKEALFDVHGTQLITELVKHVKGTDNTLTENILSLVNEPFVWPVNQEPVQVVVGDPESSDEEEEDLDQEEAVIDPDEVYVSESSDDEESDDLPVSKHYLASAPLEETQDQTHLFFNQFSSRALKKLCLEDDEFAGGMAQTLTVETWQTLIDLYEAQPDIPLGAFFVFAAVKSKLSFQDQIAKFCSSQKTDNRGVEALRK